MATHRAIPARPRLDQYRKQAKDLLDGIEKHVPDALSRLAQHHPQQKPTVKLADAQLVIAREHGFDSWPKFAAHLRTLQEGPPDTWQERIRAGEVELALEVGGRRNARALVLFVLAGNVGRYHTGIREIAAAFHRASFCTVLADLLTEDEEVEDAIHEQLRHEIPLLAIRMSAIVDRFLCDAALKSLPIGLFCSGTGGAVGAVTARQRSAAIRAFVCSAGRPDLGGSALAWLAAPSLFIFGGEDTVGHGFMRTLLSVLPKQLPQRLEVIDGAADRFDAGPHAARAAALARAWFEQYLCDAVSVAEARP